MILDKSSGIHWGNIRIRDKVFEIKPKYHLFGHAHESCGINEYNHIVFSNGAVFDDQYRFNDTKNFFRV